VSLPRRISHRLRYAGRRHRCPNCGARLRAFERYSAIGRRCPRCGARDRHRLLAVYLETESPVAGAQPRVLHVAPESSVAIVLERLGCSEYRSVDLEPGAAERAADVTDLPFADRSFDLVVCSHVLEHVADDRRALSELARVVSGRGEVLLLTPMSHDLERTVEDPAASAIERRRRFGQADHVRVYGVDLIERIRAAGLAARRFDADDVDEDRRRRAGIRGEFGAHGLRNELFACVAAARAGAVTVRDQWSG
jgi:SAM-dependent methyltransferase